MIPPSIDVEPNPLILSQPLYTEVSLPIQGTLVITNTGPGALSGPIQVSLTTNGNSQFTLASSPNPCSGVGALPMGSSCTTRVVFKGCYNGNPPTATLNILAPNAANGTQTVPVGLEDGVGQCVPSISVSPSSVDFPLCTSNNCFQPPTPIVVTITNSGGGTLQVGTVSITATDSQGQQVDGFFTSSMDSGCAGIPAGQQCTISVAVPKPDYFAVSGNMVINSNALEGPQSVPLSWPKTPQLG